MEETKAELTASTLPLTPVEQFQRQLEFNLLNMAQLLLANVFAAERINDETKQRIHRLALKLAAYTEVTE
jgi:hypothetical protein